MSSRMFCYVKLWEIKNTLIKKLLSSTWYHHIWIRVSGELKVPQGLLLLLSRFSRVQLCATPERAAHQAPLSLGFSRQEHWSGLPFPSPMHESEKWTWSRSVVSDFSRPHGLQPTRLLHPWDFPGKSTGVGCHCLLRSQGLRGLYWEWLLLLERQDLLQPQLKQRQLFKITQPPTQLTLSFASSRLNSLTTRLVLKSHKPLFRSSYAVLRSNTVETLNPDVERCLSTGAWGALPGEQDKKPSFSLTSLLFKGHMNCLYRDQSLRVQCGRQALSPYRGTFKIHASSQFVNRICSMMAGVRASLRPLAYFFPHLLCQTTASSPNMSFHQELTTLHGTRPQQNVASAFFFPLLTDFQPPVPAVLKHAELFTSSRRLHMALLSA